MNSTMNMQLKDEPGDGRVHGDSQCHNIIYVSIGVDYFENLCLDAHNACKDGRTFSPPPAKASENLVNLVRFHFYADKQLAATSAEQCQQMCETETDFLCRSFLYLADSNGRI